MNIAVFASGNGSNFEALLKAQDKDGLGSGRITLLVSDVPGAYALRRAEKHGVRTFVLDGNSFANREDFDKSVLNQLSESGVDLVVLAGFMRILTPVLIEPYRGRMVNIHPSLLPCFRGAHAIKDAFEHGVRITGVTVHFVTTELDNGPIIAQECVPVSQDDDLSALEEKIHRVEHRIYPEAVRLLARGDLEIRGRKVISK